MNLILLQLIKINRSIQLFSLAIIHKKVIKIIISSINKNSLIISPELKSISHGSPLYYGPKEPI